MDGKLLWGEVLCFELPRNRVSCLEEGKGVVCEEAKAVGEISWKGIASATL